jgi:hypothetical protein
MMLVVKSYTVPTLYKKGAVIFSFLWYSPKSNKPNPKSHNADPTTGVPTTS